MPTTQLTRPSHTNSGLSALVSIPLDKSISLEAIRAMRNGDYQHLTPVDMDDVRVLTTHASDLAVATTTPQVVIAGAAPTLLSEATTMKAYLSAIAGLPRAAIRVSGVGFGVPDPHDPECARLPLRCDPEFSKLVRGDMRQRSTWALALENARAADLIYMRNPFIQVQGNFLLCIAQALTHLKKSGSLILLIRDHDVGFFKASTALLADHDIHPFRQVLTNLNPERYTVFEPHHMLAIFKRPPTTAIGALAEHVIRRFPDAVRPMH